MSRVKVLRNENTPSVWRYSHVIGEDEELYDRDIEKTQKNIAEYVRRCNLPSEDMIRESFIRSTRRCHVEFGFYAQLILDKPGQALVFLTDADQVYAFALLSYYYVGPPHYSGREAGDGDYVAISHICSCRSGAGTDLVRYIVQQHLSKGFFVRAAALDAAMGFWDKWLVNKKPKAIKMKGEYGYRYFYWKPENPRP